ncbi:hypothetical protein CAPTEDRAFT_152966 [Capitella teleta]|uniref:NOT2/NOT3/NOT5 C-terminal domain-containing protein n=1 Tax=Capitella teleta TaxID=283909 RepID=R7VI63_CAPTE|nr:hypothetical protein CAPTEDRAFT_152966 [Capitella teleta]|eukprot:ELU18222.1 hypothetical protein CAPTEDRAFT_152966 [Capitella teleta]
MPGSNLTSSIVSSMATNTNTLSNMAALQVQQQQQQQRNNPPFQRNITPTNLNPTSLGPPTSGSLVGGSGAPSFPISLQQPQPGNPQQAAQQVSPNSRNLFSLSQRSMFSQMSNQNTIKRSNPQSSGLFGSGAGISSMAGFDFGPNVDQPQLDLSDFPSLGNRTAPINPVQPSRSYGMVSKQVQDPAPEFTIQQEDFPALPGAQNPQTPSQDSARKTPTSTSSYDMALKDRFPGDKANNSQKRGIQTLNDGTVSNIPPDMVMDQFGMVGLLTFIRAAETDPNLVALAPGIDLTTLGLNLNSPGNLYSTFQSPWADAPCRPQDIDYHVPSEYLTSIFIRDKLAQIRLNRYQEDLLFFLFYLNGGDVLQLAAAAELYSRDWRYHKEERVWLTRVPGVEPVSRAAVYERSTYFFFDVNNWRKVQKEFHLEYDKLEERPHCPIVKGYNK